MARRLDAFPEPQERADKYPWDAWGDGSVWELVRGTDFKTTVSSMRQTAMKAAKRYGKVARTRAYKRDNIESLAIQFVEPEPARRGGKTTNGARTAS